MQLRVHRFYGHQRSLIQSRIPTEWLLMCDMDYNYDVLDQKLGHTGRKQRWRRRLFPLINVIVAFSCLRHRQMLEVLSYWVVRPSVSVHLCARASVCASAPLFTFISSIWHWTEIMWFWMSCVRTFEVEVTEDIFKNAFLNKLIWRLLAVLQIYANQVTSRPNIGIQGGSPSSSV